MSFAPIPQPGSEASGTRQPLLPGAGQPDAHAVAEIEPRNRRGESSLQTELDSERLQKRLLSLFYDARTYEEEQGVNILFLAVGFLKWFEAEASERERYAPLLLVPVTLERTAVTERFRLKYTDDELETNLSLQAKLKVEFGIALPDVPEAEELEPADYFANVASAVNSQSRWEVLPNDVVLGFFSFAKFLMFRDLDPAHWPAIRGIDEHPLISGLLGAGFGNEPPLCGDDDKIDPLISPREMIHVLDADSSQTVAIEEVKRGRNLVIQGPPGTGKSQTIVNVIATAVRAGKKVLFVAEKMAALDVVKRRMEEVGLGDICLELHSRKAKRKRVIEELGRTLDLPRPVIGAVDEQAEQLRSLRDRLNVHPEAMHTTYQPSRLTPYQLIGEHVRLRRQRVKPPDFRLDDVHEWSAKGLRERERAVEDLVDRIDDLGMPSANPWRGVNVEAQDMLPAEVARLESRLKSVLQDCSGLIETIVRLSNLLDVDTALYFSEALKLAGLGTLAARVPEADRSQLADAVWIDQGPDIERLLRSGQQLSESRVSLKDIVSESAWSSDAASIRDQLSSRGRSPFRFLNGAWRSARVAFRGFLIGRDPRKLSQRLELLDTLICGQSARQRIAEGDSLGRSAFGRLWRGEDSNWPVLDAIQVWVQESRQLSAPKNFLQVVGRLDGLDMVDALSAQLAKRVPQLIQRLEEVFGLLNLDRAGAFGVEDIREIGLDNLRSRFAAWRGDTENLSKWIALCDRLKNARQAGLAALVDRLTDGRIKPREAMRQFHYVYYEQMVRQISSQSSDFMGFDGRSQERSISEFQTLDKERIRNARDEVAVQHYVGIPRGDSGLGEVGVVRREMNKTRRFLRTRRLIERAGRAIQKIKPVFMMSPISVAQFLPPGKVQFDVVIIDEASQVQPVDALGAIARSGQIVIVGDDKQLPPTRFFAKALAGNLDDPSEEDSESPGDLESILGLCRTQNVPQRTLRWHYRSRHHSLIAVSNREFYNDRLYVVPSPFVRERGLGVHFQYLPKGVYDRGGSRRNVLEAKAVAEAALDHARKHPTQSLGIGTFSVAQRDAVLDELELSWRSNAGVQHYFAPGRLEPFFVKNLENIQGDERDVIFLSVGYARDEAGFFAMNFGPLSTDGGERRLNVLITRARLRCKVFSSITADDIDLGRARSRGAAALKRYLHYAQTGDLEINQPTVRGFDSLFEEEVAKAIQANGYSVEPQVNVAKFFIDLAVKDPEKPGRYLLGIECDGASYHSSRSARDRDRLRQEVLEKRGWMIHRIWSTDWFRRPDEQLRKALAAIERAKTNLAQDASADVPERRSVRSNSSVIKREPEDGAPTPPAVPTVPYEEARFSVRVRQEPHEVRIRVMVDIVMRIVAIEGPIHQDEIAIRVRQLWGLGRTGNRIMQSVRRGLRHALADNNLRREGAFYDKVDPHDMPIRDRSNTASSTLRNPDMLPPVEMRQALRAVVATQVGPTRDESIGAAAHLLGIRRTSQHLHDVIDLQIDLLVRSGVLLETDGRLYIEAQPDNSPR